MIDGLTTHNLESKLQKIQNFISHSCKKIRKYQTFHTFQQVSW